MLPRQGGVPLIVGVNVVKTNQAHHPHCCQGQQAQGGLGPAPAQEEENHCGSHNDSDPQEHHRGQRHLILVRHLEALPHAEQVLPEHGVIPKHHLEVVGAGEEEDQRPRHQAGQPGLPGGQPNQAQQEKHRQGVPEKQGGIARPADSVPPRQGQGKGADGQPRRHQQQKRQHRGAGQDSFGFLGLHRLFVSSFRGLLRCPVVISRQHPVAEGGDTVDLRRARLIPGASILAGPVGGPVIPAAVGEEDIPSLVPQTVVAGQEGSAGIQAKEVGHRGQHVQAGGHLVNLGGR